MNYDFPSTIEDYIHRIGRTGRAGKKGDSYSFFTIKDSGLAADLMNVGAFYLDLQEDRQGFPQGSVPLCGEEPVQE